jgi:lysophospholipase L1-like esterase
VNLSYLALGDSYTIGESVSPAERFPIQLTARLRELGLNMDEPVIIARTGWTTDELWDRLESSAPQGPFDLVTLLIGVNNQYRGRAADEYRPEFAQLLTRAIGYAGSRPGHVIVVSIPDWGVTPFGANRQNVGMEIDRFNAVNREETRAHGAQYVDITPMSRVALHDRALIAGDGLHPSGKMYAQWVELLLPLALAALRGAD